MVNQLLSEVIRHIGILNQKEYFERSDETTQMINNAMANIQFNFSRIGKEEMQIISAAQLQEKWEYTIHSFTQNEDQEDPEYITLREAFMMRFKEHGFVIDSVAKFNEQSKAMDDFITKLRELRRKNQSLASKYNGDMKFARVHKRIKEKNNLVHRTDGKSMMNNDDFEIVEALTKIKNDIDQKVYDRNDILKKDAYFEQTVMRELSLCINDMNLITARDDKVFMQKCISKQYLNQYHDTYGIGF